MWLHIVQSNIGSPCTFHSLACTRWNFNRNVCRITFWVIWWNQPLEQMWFYSAATDFVLYLKKKTMMKNRMDSNNVDCILCRHNLGPTQVHKQSRSWFICEDYVWPLDFSLHFTSLRLTLLSIKQRLFTVKIVKWWLPVFDIYVCR